MKELYADIAVELPIEGTFSYMVPPVLEKDAGIGKRALVQFGKRTVTGYIIGLGGKRPEDVKEIKPILDLIDEYPVFDEKRLNFFKWIAQYYFAPLGEVLSLIHPGSASIKSGRSFHLTESGKAAPGMEGLSSEIISAAKDGVSISTLLKRFKGKPVYSTVERLKKAGLIEEEITLKGNKGPKTEKFLKPTEGRADLEQLSKKSPIQFKVYRHLLENGEAATSALTASFGNISHAVKGLHQKGLVEISERESLRDPLSEIVPREARFEPNEEQRKAIEEITSSVRENIFSPFLLYGVTGSGKTLVYLKTIKETIKAGKKAIILSPEISLTPWPAAYLAGKFPGRVAIQHSGLSEGERLDEWRRILKGDVDVVVGARSALFAPLKDLGLIIVDEEHETSYKQEDGVRYHARDAALMLGKYLGATVVLGSATPSVETFHNATAAGKIKPLYLRKRVEERPLPSIEVIDMKGRKGEIISDKLKVLMGEALEKGEQSLLFLNRRGFSGSLICKDCGHTFNCLNCSVTLTMHKRGRSLVCHYCDLAIPIPEECPKCRSIELIHPGIGTEKVEEEVRALFPSARVGRMDRDTTRLKGSAKKIIDAVEDKRVDILIGTQMVSKGHHFPGITLVGVISGDTSLNIPDFRSSERTFQLITQAAGRSGRGEVPGRVVIQTLNPEHYCFDCAIESDYDGFFKEETVLREELSYPPYSRLCNLKLEANNEARIKSAADTLRMIADTVKSREGITVLGPAPALIEKVKGRFRWQMLVKGREIKVLHAFVSRVRSGFEAKKLSGVNLILDMDPLNII